MTDLIATIGTGKGTWAMLYKIIELEKWNKILLVSNEFGKQNFKCPDNAEIIVVEETSSSTQNIFNLVKNLQGKISYDTVAVNFFSGTGKQHMELLGALLKLGSTFRLISLENDKVVEI